MKNMRFLLCLFFCSIFITRLPAQSATPRFNHTTIFVVDLKKSADCVPSVEAFAKRLDAMNIKYGNWAQTSKEPQVRPDGVKQIYLQDPEGYWLEVDDDKF